MTAVDASPAGAQGDLLEPQNSERVQNMSTVRCMQMKIIFTDEIFKRYSV